MAWIWSAFVRLCRSRTAGFSGANPISFAEIDAFARLTGLSEDDTVELTEYVETLDRAFFDIQREAKDTTIGE